MNRNPGISDLDQPWLVFVLAGLMVTSLVFVGVTFFQLMRNAAHEREWISLATSVQVGSQRLSKSAGEAASGNLEAFEELASTNDRMASDMSRLLNGFSADGLPPTPAEVQRQMNEVEITWDRMSVNAARITDREQLLLSLADASSSFLLAIPDIQARSDQVVRQLTESGAPNQQVFASGRQLVLADRMLRRVNEILQGGSNAVSAAENLRKEIALFDQLQNALRSGNQRMGITPVRNQQALSSLGQVRSQFSKARSHLQAILDSSGDLFEVRGAADEIFLDSREMFNRAAALSSAVAILPRTRTWPSQQTAGIGLVVMIALVALLVRSLFATQRRRARLATSSNRHKQKAILRLLDELSSLADGDLTVQATVTDEFTGAIADAVNYAVEQLRELVTDINDTANAVAESAQTTRTEISRLAATASEQAGQVGRVTEKIQSMATAFNSMAKRSTDSSDAAHESVNIAHSGAKKVHETIAGMDNIREQIQETSKRIKRLGESSQEIGDIVGLINGIAEQTNVLALNAAIQAASAGGAGRGFAVVADEVQQLAESATQATRRIETLVQTIQADTNEAVSSMEETTGEVVQGTQLARDAGKALVKIENVSNDLSGLIQEISNEALTQSQKATRISELMDGIRDVSVKTSEGGRQTVTAVEKLAELVYQLRESVADFKLPEDR